MSLGEPPMKRFKQSSISDFFAVPEHLSNKRVQCSGGNLSRNGEAISSKCKEVDDSLKDSEDETKTMDEHAAAGGSSSSPSSSIDSPDDPSETNAAEKQKRSRELELDPTSRSDCGRIGVNSGSSSEGATAAPSRSTWTKTKDPKRFYSKRDETLSPETPRDSQPIQDDIMNYSFDPEESRREIQMPSLNLEQEAGVMPDDLIRFPTDVTWRPGDLQNSAEHTVLIQTPYKPGSSAPCPSPENCIDIWDQHHVKMPNSAHSLYIDPDGEQIPRWDRIERALLTPMRSFHDFRDAVLSYNGGFTWDLEEFEDFLEEMTRSERVSFFEQLLPAIVNLALRMPSICTKPPPLLTEGKSHSITMSQVQASCMLANAFLSTFPRRNTTKPESQFYNYPSINFHTLFNRCHREKRRSCRKEKIKCILNYFRRVTEKEPEGNITFARIKLGCTLGWEASQAQFQKAFVTSEGLIEDQGYGMLMVDFANRRVGGGVLRDGCVQEETLFVLYPELICARLFTEALGDDEALLVTGVERFNQYKGFSDQFTWTGNVVDLADRDPWGRKYTQIVAIDALAHRGKRQQREQFSTEKITRELVKAFCGFKTPGFPRSCLATGNWGCGAFGGDARLKFLIQWMAASRAGRQLTYFTFGNHELMCELRALQELVTEHHISVGDLFLLLRRYDSLYVSNESRDYPSLSEYLFQNFSSQDSD